MYKWSPPQTCRITAGEVWWGKIRAGVVDLGIHSHLSSVTKEVKIEHNSRGLKM